ncbi:hypothetical protein JMJ77_0009102, partial [Colletotrichum scovillei]
MKPFSVGKALALVKLNTKNSKNVLARPRYLNNNFVQLNHGKAFPQTLISTSKDKVHHNLPVQYFSRHLSGGIETHHISSKRPTS